MSKRDGPGTSTNEQVRNYVETSTLEDFGECLLALDGFRNANFATPPFTAVEEIWEHGGSSYIINAGRIEGTHHQDFDLENPAIRAIFSFEAFKFIQYYGESLQNGTTFLTDGPKLSQYVLGNSEQAVDRTPYFVDLELHTGSGPDVVIDQLDLWFRELLTPLEQARGEPLRGLREAAGVVVMDAWGSLSLHDGGREANQLLEKLGFVGDY